MVVTMLERDIRKALKTRVEALGGEVRAIGYLGRSHCPDVLCLFPGFGKHFMVETKAPGGTPRAGQDREHKRLRAAGIRVILISTLEELDRLLPFGA